MNLLRRVLTPALSLLPVLLFQLVPAAPCAAQATPAGPGGAPPPGAGSGQPVGLGSEHDAHQPRHQVTALLDSGGKKRG